jgi:hypothetical protein
MVRPPECERTNRQLINGKNEQLSYVIVDGALRRAGFGGVDAVALDLGVKRFVVHPQQTSRLARVSVRGSKRKADRLALGLGCGSAADFFQGGLHRASSRAARFHQRTEEMLATCGPTVRLGRFRNYRLGTLS